MTNLHVRQNGRGAPARHALWGPFGSRGGAWALDPLLRGWARPAETAGRLRVEFSPSFDIIEREDSFVLVADLPGVSERDLDVSAAGNQLTVSGSRRGGEPGEGEHYYLSERLRGEFTRSFALPQEAAMESAEASLENGELTITIPKRSEAQPRRIPIGGRSAGE